MKITFDKPPKISDLIHSLEGMKSVHGDVEVWLVHAGSEPITSIEYEQSSARYKIPERLEIG